MRQIVFLAYTRTDSAWAKKISASLEAAGISTWVDAESIQPGIEWERAISEALRDTFVIVAIASRSATKSAWIGHELGYAFAAGTKIIPVTVDGAILPQLESIQHLDLRGLADVPRALVDAVQQLIPPEAPEPRGLARAFFEAVRDGELGSDLEDLMQRAVLLLGGFEEEEKGHLLQLQGALDGRGFHPIVFDFAKPPGADFGETARLLAGVSGFVIADLAGPRSVLMELQLIAPTLAIPIVLLAPHRESGAQVPALLADLQKYDWVLPVRFYESFDEIVGGFDENVISPARTKQDEIRERKNRA